MPNDNRQSLLVIGECMMELSEEGDAYQRAFAGDTYNSAVYAKRRHRDLDVQILTAIGVDPISEAMVAQWDRDGVGHDLTMQANAAHPGIYAISTDASGERSFTYWRSNSAATQMITLLTPRVSRRARTFDFVFFSGITMAILSDEDKGKLIQFVRSLKENGAVIAFDPNYRAVLWRDKDHASQWIIEAYGLTNIALPGLSDHEEIFGHHSKEDVRHFLESFDIDEIILKAEDEGVFAYLQDQPTMHLSVDQETNPRDTTGAGDSFAGTYLAERLKQTPIAYALESAAQVASLVVQHRGAILDADIYQQLS